MSPDHEDRSANARGPQHCTHYDDCGCQSAALKARIATLEASLRDAEESRDAATSLLADTRADIHWTEVIDLKRKVATLEADYQTARTAVEVESALVRQWQAHAATLRDALVRKNMALRVLVEAGDSYREWSKDAPFGEALTAALVECASMNEVAQTPAQSLAALKAEVGNGTFDRKAFNIAFLPVPMEGPDDRP